MLFSLFMGNQKRDEIYSEEETARRRDEALRKALSTPPTPHKTATSPKRKEHPASKGRVHKGKNPN
jgi:hypothetical protein